jgi:hypothetical protein
VVAVHVTGSRSSSALPRGGPGASEPPDAHLGVPLVETRVYAPRDLMGARAWETCWPCRAAGWSTRRTASSRPARIRSPSSDAALPRRAGAPRGARARLAERWCAYENDRLFIDGGISGSEAVAVSACTVGVVKSHRTLYAEGPALAVVLGLGHGERSSVFRVTSPRRTPVASWYLRLRDHDGRDPMWGLLRVEIAHPQPQEIHAIGDRADEVSRWILAEASPLALPDARWDKMVYGIRDCEEFLRAVAG